MHNFKDNMKNTFDSSGKAKAFYFLLCITPDVYHTLHLKRCFEIMLTKNVAETDWKSKA